MDPHIGRLGSCHRPLTQRGPRGAPPSHDKVLTKGKKEKKKGKGKRRKKKEGKKGKRRGKEKRKGGKRGKEKRKKVEKKGR